MSNTIRRKASSFEEYWLASKAWERKGLTLGTARALVNAGFLTVDDLHTAHELELATIPRVGRKSLEILYGLMGREMPSSAWVGQNGAPAGASIQSNAQLVCPRWERDALQRRSNGSCPLIPAATQSKSETPTVCLCFQPQPVGPYASAEGRLYA